MEPEPCHVELCELRFWGHLSTKPLQERSDQFCPAAFLEEQGLSNPNSDGGIQSMVRGGFPMGDWPVGEARANCSPLFIPESGEKNINAHPGRAGARGINNASG